MHAAQAAAMAHNHVHVVAVLALNCCRQGVVCGNAFLRVCGSAVVALCNHHFSSHVFNSAGRKLNLFALGWDAVWDPQCAFHAACKLVRGTPATTHTQVEKTRDERALLSALQICLALLQDPSYADDEVCQQRCRTSCILQSAQWATCCTPIERKEHAHKHAGQHRPAAEPGAANSRHARCGVAHSGTHRSLNRTSSGGADL